MPAGRLYKWNPGATFKADAQQVGEYLEELREQNGGVLTTDDIWQDAQVNEDAPHHSDFQWNVEEAAKLHWRERARDLLRHIAVVRVHMDEPTDGFNAFVNVVADDGQRGYVSVDAVVSNEDYKLQAMKQCLNMLNGLQRRFGWLEELQPIWSAVRKAEKKRAKSKKAA
jgi:hypothetical protein